MTIERGLLLNGSVVPGSEWVLRDTSAWYSPGDDDVYERTVMPPELLTFHWTAGPRRRGELAAQKTYRAMQARRKDDGKEMSVSAQCVLADDGQLYQLADLSLCCVHAHRQFNLRGVGVEYAFPGTLANSIALGGDPDEPSVVRRVAGRSVRCVIPSRAAIATGIRFAELLHAAFGLPRIAHIRRERFASRQMARARGACEHYHADGTTKLDVAGFFVDALADHGWESA